MTYIQSQPFEVPKYVRHKPAYMIKFPDRDYSVNRAERRKKNKRKKGKRA